MKEAKTTNLKDHYLQNVIVGGRDSITGARPTGNCSHAELSVSITNTLKEQAGF